MQPGAALQELRAKAPLVHCITNYVAMNIAANVTLAAGASPAMIHAIEEVADFTPIAGALTINIGTVSQPWADAMIKAAEAANSSGTPWIFDPVAHFATPYRSKVANQLMALKPTILRGNASEIIALAGEAGSGKGVDSGDEVDAAKQAAQHLANEYGSVVVVTGEIDLATDGEKSARVSGGSPLMPKVTALGCALTALMGGYAAIADPFDAAVAALAHFGAAGAKAHRAAQGPGSFQTHFLDQLAAATADDLEGGLITWE
ncbi:MAG: hydroxyethylthiazole kinase [Pseudomonadota bacterium]